MPDVILRSADPFCDSEEYLAALFAENEAVRAVNAVNLLRETAFAARNKYFGSTKFSFSAYLSADNSFWQHTKAFMTKMAALDAASKVTFFARQTCLSAVWHPILAAAPICVSLEFPAPFPSSHDRTRSLLPCPDLWTALEISAAARASSKLHMCSSLFLPYHVANDRRTVRIRFQMLAKLLHPDRWLATWAEALKSVPAAWAVVLDLSHGTVDAVPESARGESLHFPPGYRRWTVADVRASAEAAFIAAREAYEALCVT